MAKALFLDRDGVINREKAGSYIFTKDEFAFYEGVPEALAQLAAAFDYIIIVTNQRGIGRGLMTEDALKEIHDHLKTEVEKLGGRIDAIYYAPFTDGNHPYRKPNPGMALAAKQAFPDIDFAQSVMIGNNLSDMQFGRTMGMKTVFLHTTQRQMNMPHPLIDEQAASLGAWTERAGR
jgi:histidinol-phosphate phosphatase family protein